MDAIFILSLVFGGFAGGYAFRALIGKEIKAIGADIRAEYAKAVAAANAEYIKAVADVKKAL